MRQRRRVFVVATMMTVPWLISASAVWGGTQAILTLRSQAAILVDGVTDQILFSKNPEKRFPPASLAKMMTLYLAWDAVQRGEVKLDDEVLVSKKAWKMGGSQMFLEVGDRVKLVELIKGAAVVSANDAALAIAEFLAGSEEVFVHQMNEKAEAIGMKNTHFVNPHGLPREGQYTTAADMAILGLHYLRDHPRALEFHRLPTYTYGGIEQRNWNPLLKLDQSVDGLKTGYLKISGYHILFSAKRDGRRLIGVVMGAETAESRNDDALKLIGYGFKNFSTRTLVGKGEVVAKVAVPSGDPPEVSLRASEALVVTVPKDREISIPLRKEIPSSVSPPIGKGTILGKLVLEGEGFPKKEVNLIATRDVQVKSYSVYYLIGLGIGVGLFGFVIWKRRGSGKKR